MFLGTPFLFKWRDILSLMGTLFWLPLCGSGDILHQEDSMRNWKIIEKEIAG